MSLGPFSLVLTQEAKEQISQIDTASGLFKQLKKAFRFLQNNPTHPGLNSHKMLGFESLYDVKVFTSYVQNNTPSAHRILWAYGPQDKQITILAVIPHY